MKKRSTTKFGNGKFVGDFLHPDSEILDFNDRNLARELGWAAGCPVVERLTDPESTDLGRGPASMIERYGEVAFWFGQLTRELNDTNPQLAQQLSSSQPRNTQAIENITAFDEASIPPDYFETMAPLGQLAGYALPRVLIEQMKYKGDDAATDNVQRRLVKGLELFGDSARQSTSLPELTAKFGEAVSTESADPDKVLSHILAEGWLEEHGDVEMFRAMEEAVKTFAPSLWRRYQLAKVQE